MAAGDITYGTRTVLADVSRIHSRTNGTAVAFGRIVGAGEIGINIHLTVPIHASATSGTYDLYLVESQDDTEWTDMINPATAGDVAPKIFGARFLHSARTVYNATHRTQARFHITVPMLASSKYIGFVLMNNSGQTIPASGADGDSQSYTVS